MRLAGGNLAAIVKTIQAVHHTQAMIHGLRRGLGFAIKLMADVIEQSGLGDFGQKLGCLCEPAGEVQQVIGVSPQRTQRELAHALGIQKGVGPGDLLPVRSEQAIGRSAGGNKRVGGPEKGS
jgi:hypothetical protein